ncbi:hypothetical protein CLPU_3c00110 [Gottschalkia purinilytica]|uniref:Elp3/MiaA/NifB-like radical SAM core domain-containing protein n=1 Tax=Gottschalkia purinilytica TaxID=1503 RepID=A0A0L0WCP0_GOTPU|nr:radical SAM protein [Gottschalkia purinilytica]KNF09233.1 hypothetical protein CLPU_3c00110 [Gottschalkia purinilytica]
MNRYSEIKEKNKREILLLKGLPCIWGKCTFCDYIDDNSSREDEINKINFEEIKKVTGKYKVLEVINSGSCFEMPKDTLNKIKEKIKEKGITKLFLESHWAYRYKLDEMREFFGIPIIFKTGIETFDNYFRNKVLNKNAKFETYEDVLKYFDSPCIMVGIKGQTKDMIKKDMDIIINKFSHATVNVFVENSTELKRDEELIKWFEKEYAFLEDLEHIEVLLNNTDFGVGD